MGAATMLIWHPPRLCMILDDTKLTSQRESSGNRERVGVPYPMGRLELSDTHDQEISLLHGSAGGFYCPLIGG